MLKVEPAEDKKKVKRERGPILFCQGIKQETLDYLKVQQKKLGYGRMSKYLDALVEALKKG